MKRLWFIILLLSAVTAKAQNRLWGNGFYSIRDNKFGFFGTSGTDSVGYIDSLKIKWFKPVRPGIYTTAGAPTASDYPGYVIYNSDSSKLQFSNGSGWITLGGSSGGGGGSSYTFQHSLTESGGFVNLVNDAASPGNLYFYGTNGSGTKGFQSLTATAFVQNGNSFGSGAVLGTNDNNVLDIELNNTTKHRFQTDGTVSLNTTTDVSQILYVYGTSRFDGLMTFGANAGFSASSGVQMNSFGANGVTNTWLWGLNSAYANPGATRNFFVLTGDQTNSAATTQTINQLLINPTINNTSGTTTLRAVYFNPTLTSTTGTTITAFQNVVGDNVFNSTSGNTGIGTSPSAKLHVSGSVRFDGTGTGNATDLYLVKGTDSVIREVAAGSVGIYGSNGTLTGTRAVSGGGFGLELGASGNALASLIVRSSDNITLNGTLTLGPVVTATDANYTVLTGASVINLPEITSNRTIALPAAAAGKILIIWNQNSSGNNWSFGGGGATVINPASGSITTLTNDTVYILLGTGSDFLKIN